MPRTPRVAGIQLGFPLVKQPQRCIGITDFIAQVIRDSAIGIDIEEILPYPLWKKPARNRKILVVRTRQTTAVLLRLSKAWSSLGNSVLGRKTAPPLEA